MSVTVLGVLLIAIGVLLTLTTDETGTPVESVLDVAPVWAGHPVQFALLTCGRRQYVAFYDQDRRLTLAVRKLDSREWQFAHLPEMLNWDSHNLIAIAADGLGFLHLSANMHVHPLIYYRTTLPGDITSFQRVAAMVGQNELRCTYPQFLHGPDGQLLFTYRDGASGSGDQIWNAYDAATQAWRRLLDRPLTAGHDRMNAYFHGPIRGPDGWFHLCWVWRDTPDCTSNHDLSYARSRDLVSWETSDGKPLGLPITIETGEIVDPVPPGGGMLNGNAVIGFDHEKRPIISYHKFDEHGNTQVYAARREESGWCIYKTSDWTYRWAFSGPGAIVCDIRVFPVRPEPDGRLTECWWHAKLGDGVWLLNQTTLRPTATLARSGEMPAEICRGAVSQPGMEVQTCEDAGASDENSVRYVLRWETLPANRDRARQGPPPAPTMLRLVRLRAAANAASAS